MDLKGIFRGPTKWFIFGVKPSILGETTTVGAGHRKPGFDATGLHLLTSLVLHTVHMQGTDLALVTSQRGS
jgi:hypothetical protein